MSKLKILNKILIISELLVVLSVNCEGEPLARIILEVKNILVIKLFIAMSEK